LESLPKNDFYQTRILSMNIIEKDAPLKKQ